MIGTSAALRVVDRLDRLRHDAVVGRDHDHGDVRDLGAAGAHGGERLVARGVEEGDRLVAVVHLVGADVLGDAAGLAGRDLGLADGVEQRGLAVVDVAHDRDHRRALDQVLVGVVERRLAPRPRRRRGRSRSSCSNSSASTSIASSESVCVSVAISPSSISFLITSGEAQPSDSATSLTVEPEGTWTGGRLLGRARRCGRPQIGLDPLGARRRAAAAAARRLLLGRRPPARWRRAACESITTRRRAPRRHRRAAAARGASPPRRWPRAGRSRGRWRAAAVGRRSGCGRPLCRRRSRGGPLARWPARAAGRPVGARRAAGCRWARRGRAGGRSAGCGAAPSRRLRRLLGAVARRRAPMSASRRRSRQRPSRRGRPSGAPRCTLLAGDPVLLGYLVDALLCHRRTKSMVSRWTVTGARKAALDGRLRSRLLGALSSGQT